MPSFIIIDDPPGPPISFCYLPDDIFSQLLKSISFSQNFISFTKTRKKEDSPKIARKKNPTRKKISFFPSWHPNQKKKEFFLLVDSKKKFQLAFQQDFFIYRFIIQLINQGGATGTRQAPLYLVCLGVVSIDPSLQSDTQDYLTIQQFEEVF